MGRFSETTATAVMQAVRNASAFSYAAVWVKLHTGSPTSVGTAAAAGNTTRMQATFGSAASSGAISNTTAISWTSVGTQETYSYVSLWSSSSGGSFIGADDLSSAAGMATGDTFTIQTGDLDLTLDWFS